MNVLDPNKQKSKKIVINNLKKSLMATINPSNPSQQHGQTLPQISQSLTLNPQGQPIPNPATNSTASFAKQVARLNEQLTYYRQKHDQSLIKVRFLSEKLETYGGLNSIPETIVNQISQTDLKIRNLEELFYFRRNKQLRKLRKKILKFINMLQFDVTEDDLNKIDDQFGMVHLLLDLFTQKYNQLMSQKTQIDQIIDSLKQDTVFNRQKLQQQNKYLKQKITEQSQYVRDLQIQVFNLKRQTQTMGRVNYNVQSLLRSPSNYSNTNLQKGNRVYEETIHALQVQNEDLIVKAKKLEQTIKNNQYEIITLKRKVEEYEIILEKERGKYRELDQELNKVLREEVRWRERYDLMESQKNQRIELLQKQKKAMQAMNNGYTNFHKKTATSLNSPASQKKSYISLKNKKASSDQKYEISEQIIQDSSEEYYDVSEI